VSGYLKFSNGIVYSIDNSTVTWIRDRNGNMVTLSYGNTVLSGPNWYFNVPAPTQIMDSDGRVVNINYSDSSCGGCASITYTGVGGTSQAIQVLTTYLGNALRGG